MGLTVTRSIRRLCALALSILLVAGLVLGATRGAHALVVTDSLTSYTGNFTNSGHTGPSGTTLSNPGGFVNIGVNSNLSTLIGSSSLSGDFRWQVDVVDSLSSGIGMFLYTVMGTQSLDAELFRQGTGAPYFAVGSNNIVSSLNWSNPGQGVNMPLAGSGTFVVTRVAGVVTESWNGVPFGTYTVSNALTRIGFQLYGTGSGSITFRNFLLTTAVPEPSSLALVLACMAACLLARRLSASTRAAQTPIRLDF
jgi:hypothetical protein